MESNKKNTYIIAAIAFVILAIGIYFLFIFQKKPKEISAQKSQEELKTLDDIVLAKRPFITLTPTSDGAEIIISIENMSEFDRIEYEITYLADNPTLSGQKIQRGATGTDVNTRDPKYKKSVLLGTASKGTRSPDKGVSDGKLSLHMFKGETEYLSETPWKLLEEGLKATTIEDSSGKFKLDLPALGKNYWIILAETIGIPPGDKQFKEDKVVLPVYGSFSVTPKFPKNASLSISPKEDVTNPVLYSYDHQDSKWQKLESRYESSTKTITSTTQSFATFIVVSPQ